MAERAYYYVVLYPRMRHETPTYRRLVTAFPKQRYFSAICVHFYDLFFENLYQNLSRSYLSCIIFYIIFLQDEIQNFTFIKVEKINKSHVYFFVTHFRF